MSKVSGEQRGKDGPRCACEGREEVAGCAIPSPCHLSPGIKAKSSNPTVDGSGNLLQHGMSLVSNKLKSCPASFYFLESSPFLKIYLPPPTPVLLDQDRSGTVVRGQRIAGTAAMFQVTFTADSGKRG